MVVNSTQAKRRSPKRRTKKPQSAETISAETETKGPDPETKGPAGETIRRSEVFNMLPADILQDHPANPPHRVLPPNVADLMELIEAYGQRDPVRVRPAAGKNYQILSGHRRVAACRILKRDVRCEVVICDDDEALREVMLGNAERKDLDPIERAELLQTMIDQGFDRDEAGAMFGLLSESGIKNALRMLKLPAGVKKLLRDGSIPARTARYLVPYSGLPKRLEQFAKDLVDPHEDLLGHFLNNPKEAVREIAEINGDAKSKWSPATCRPIDGTTTYRPAGYEFEDAGCGFEITPDIRKKLKVIEVPIAGKTMEVATNVKLFDELNKPHLKKRKGYGGASNAGGRKKPKAGKLTPAKQRAEDARKRKEADKRLKDALPVWATRFVRATLSFHTPINHPVVDATLPWLMTVAKREWVCSGIQTIDGKDPVGRSNWDQTFPKLARTLLDHIDNHELNDRIWRTLVWPQTRTGWCKADQITGGPPIEMPLPPKAYPKVAAWDGMLNVTQVSIEDSWKQSGANVSKLHELAIEFFNLHNAQHLPAFCKKMGVATKATSKRDLVAHLIRAHIDNPLPMPACLAKRASK